MKKIIYAFMLLNLSFAQAREIKLYDRTANWSLPGYMSENFAVNEKLGRAWVEIKVGDSGSEFASESNVERLLVKGLSFDQQANSIILEIDGQIVECAHLVSKGKWIFKEKVIRETGLCRFDERLVRVEVDNGFEIEVVKRTQVYLVVD